ncbi:MAG TPA: PPC domain-containing protein, partial [Verrucomicrobiae bacterium]|nr:PPC domain-containing protein [Verrucomicrobiae bacterium]
REGGVTAPSWNPLRVSTFDNVLELEPNDAAAQATAASTNLPLAFNGIIEKPGDMDWFKFSARKGEVYEVNVLARSLRSPLDPVLVVANADGSGIASNDDSGGPDSYLRFKVPNDGDFTVRVSDHLGSGGPGFTYRVEVDRVQPGLQVYVPDTTQYDTQTRKAVVVARGNRFPLLVQVRRQNFGGDLVFQPENFPPGITLTPDVLAANKESIALVFEAAADAPVGGGLAGLSARLADPKDGPRITGGLWQNVDLVQQGNQGVYYKTWVDRLAVAVVEELPFKIRIEQPQAPLVRDGTYPLKVIAERREGFGEPITVTLLARPPGLNCSPDITIAKDQTEAIYALSASGNAEIKAHKIALLGSAPVKGGTAYVSSQLATLDLTDSFVAGKMPLATTIQGNPVQVKCELTQTVPFPGPAKVELVGLPAGATAPPKTITKDDTEVVFDVTTAPDARTGLHRTLFCQLTVTYTNEVVSQSFGGRGTLRIDPPPPPPEPEKKDEAGEKPGTAQQTASK